MLTIFTYTIGIVLVMDSGTGNSSEKWIEGNVDYGFSSYCAIFDDFQKFHDTIGALHFEKSSNMAKDEEPPTKDTPKTC